MMASQMEIPALLELCSPNIRVALAVCTHA